MQQEQQAGTSEQRNAHSSTGIKINSSEDIKEKPRKKLKKCSYKKKEGQHNYDGPENYNCSGTLTTTYFFYIESIVDI